jgi:hypothetical protein
MLQHEELQEERNDYENRKYKGLAPALIILLSCFIVIGLVCSGIIYVIRFLCKF